MHAAGTISHQGWFKCLSFDSQEETQEMWQSLSKNHWQWKQVGICWWDTADHKTGEYYYSWHTLKYVPPNCPHFVGKL